ncbi:hypothetical protein BpHYR1_027860 [Brachionus plicatilis]|uniref:Uncharacterized protein n=1 Tax=Brachionus plicatilis TaxID=10195 RepID=A0A3M7SB52_BRAPC|nr:hypothetical protein BpHYR1_027860 [Brachionus plicatilis]
MAKDMAQYLGIIFLFRLKIGESLKIKVLEVSVVFIGKTETYLKNFEKSTLELRDVRVLVIGENIALKNLKFFRKWTQVFTNSEIL